MSGDNSKNEGQRPSLREAAMRLLADIDFAGRSPFVLAAPVESIEALRQALKDQRSAILMIDNPQLAADGIALIKAGGQITPEHIRAIIEAAEAAIKNEDSGILRWDATMRAIKLWQSGGEGRELIWPDHVDLLVWLLELVELQPVCPTMGDVHDMMIQLRQSDQQDGGLADAAADMIEQLANALIASSRRTVKAEAINGQLVEQMRRERERGGMSSPGDLGAGSRAQTFGGDQGGSIEHRPPRIHDSLRAILGRPDVGEAVAKALCDQNGADWAQATEGGRQAFRKDAAALLGAAARAPREGG